MVRPCPRSAPPTLPPVTQPVDIAVVGAGAAGLFASIWAGRTAHDSGRIRTILALDSARTLGAKVLVAGGGRCNVTHHAVDESAYAGSSRNAIKKVLRAFDVPQTVAFFRERGVELKREDTGKLFPTTDTARDVLDALLGAARDARVSIVHPWRVESITHRDDGLFEIVRARSGGEGTSDPLSPSIELPAQQRVHARFDAHTRGAPRPITPPITHAVAPVAPTAGSEGQEDRALSDSYLARRIILAAGGKALPRSGSDGHAYSIARALGHTITPRVFPALVPLTLPLDHFLCALSGVALPATLEVRAASGKRLVAFTNPLLLTHTGVSGPVTLDISRYFTDARADDPDAALVVNFLPTMTPDGLDRALQSLGERTPLALLREKLPERLARALLDQAGIEPTLRGANLPRDARRALVNHATNLALPISGDRGFVHAEVTAGGVPLAELHLDTMESRLCPGLHLCGEICDVDGRIGGFNFQWAWASGYLAGKAAAAALTS